jgi:hypothetical protein
VIPLILDPCPLPSPLGMVAPRGVSLSRHYGRVIAFACIDDGSTARAPPKYRMPFVIAQSPSLPHPGTHQVSLFLALLDRVPAALPKWWWFKKKTPDSRLAPAACVHHLLLSDCAEERRGQPPVWTDYLASKSPCSEGSHGVEHSEYRSNFETEMRTR